MTKPNEETDAGVRHVRIERLPREVAAILVLAEMAREDDPASPTERIRLLVPREGEPAPGKVRRAGGAPVGVDETTRPRRDGTFMHHLLTLDLDELPELRRIPRFEGARAVALFVGDHRANEATEPLTDEVHVLALSPDDIAEKGEWRGPPVEDPEPVAFDLVPVDVPITVFDGARLRLSEEGGDFDALDAPDKRIDDADKLRATLRAFIKRKAYTPAARLAALFRELVNNDHVGGRVVYWSDATYDEDFVCQFSEDLLDDVDMGESGTMYWFAKTAFWAGH